MMTAWEGFFCLALRSLRSGCSPCLTAAVTIVPMHTKATLLNTAASLSVAAQAMLDGVDGFELVFVEPPSRPYTISTPRSVTVA